jgi:hypothetical protein
MTPKQQLRRVFRMTSWIVSSLKLEWRKWRHRNTENEEMDGEKQDHISIKQHVTACYEIWQWRKLPIQYFRNYTCFQEELIVKQEDHDIIFHGILPAQLSDYVWGNG